MKTWILFLLLIFPFVVNAQPLKIFEPKTAVWDITPPTVQRLEQFKKVYAALVQGEKTVETLTTNERKLYDEFFNPEDTEPRYEFYGTTSWSGCSWYCGTELDTGYSSSFLATKNSSYPVENIHDFDVSTAWVEGKKGYGIGEKITFEFSQNNPPLTTVFIYNGYMKTEKTWTENSRVRTLKMYVNNKPYALLHLEDTIGKQRFNIDTLKPNNQPLILTFEIYDVYKGSLYDETAISEINFDGTGVHCFVTGTMVTMADGSQKAIENILAGDEVQTYDNANNCLGEGIVMATASAKHHNLIKIETENGNITATADHPIYVKNKGWCALDRKGALQYSNINTAQHLQVGDEIMMLTNGKTTYSKILSLTAENICANTFTIVSIKGGSSFFANKILVATEELK
ncbi:MAG: NADase-type glycan-binding domain-containing protein [Bacteroidota bacterium]